MHRTRQGPVRHTGLQVRPCTGSERSRVQALCGLHLASVLGVSFYLETTDPLVSKAPKNGKKGRGDEECREDEYDARDGKDGGVEYESEDVAHLQRSDGE